MEESTQSSESADIESFFSLVEDAPSEAPVENPAPVVEPVKVEPEKKDPSIDDLEALTRQQRAIWRENKKVADEKAKIKAQWEEIERLKSNPKELLNMKDAKSVDDIISRLFDEEQEKPKNVNKDPEDLYAEIEAKVLAKIEAQQKEKEEGALVESEKREFYSGLEQFIKEEGKYALVEGMGEAKLVGQVIEAQYQQDAETYGPEKALEMMMSPSEAAERVEKHLAEQIDMVLKSEKVKEFVLGRLGVATAKPAEQTGQQSSHVKLSQTTLNNEDYSTTSDGGVVDSNLTDEEAFHRALKLIP
jgi:hypothetical protein